ncbi:3-deoxy-manno-octulosonate cytidylyltransferase [Lactococcus garvieae]|nr:3-deoxy-manno-octulosonate cytidylyltransferase [Lactococcus garvieae]
MAEKKNIGVIPARYASSRFPGKPLVDFFGRPMLWWVYSQMKLVEQLSEVYVACDDTRVAEVCEMYNIPYVMTKVSHATHLDRLSEFSEKVDADFYINVNGDEPLVELQGILDLLPPDKVKANESYAANGMMILTEPIEAIDTSKIKIATDVYGNGLYMARTPIPYPKGKGDYQLKKFVGIQCFTKSALKFVSNHTRGPIEEIEDIDEYRFLEYGHKLKFVLTNVKTLSVDTRKDAEKVRGILFERIANDEVPFLDDNLRNEMLMTAKAQNFDKLSRG